MIIRGGKIFVMDDDVLPKVTITDATIIMETADSSLDWLKEFISERIGRGSEINSCTFVPIGDWAESKSKEGIAKAKNDLHLKNAPIMSRLKKALGLTAK